MTYVLAIDQSTSATKAVLFDAAGTLVDRASREHRQIYPQPGWVEHDAEEIWQNVLDTVGELALRRPGQVGELACVSIANQRETIVVFERSTGRPLHPAIVWQCRRGDDFCRRLRDAGHEEVVRSRTGLKLDAYFSASKLAWLIEARPDLRAQLERGDALVGTIDAYLTFRLTRGEVFATDHTNASRTLLYDSGALAWDEELCRLFGVPRGALPEVRESFADFGSTTIGGALARNAPICGVMGDSQASLFAQRCYARGTAKATFGTGTSLLLNVGREFRAALPGAVAALAWVRRGEPTYALEGLINYSSATVAWLKDQLGLIADPGETESLARAVADNGGVYFVPAFAGLSAPYWNPDARAAILGLSAHSRREHVVRAALESIAYQVRDVLDMMRADAGVEATVLYADGGPTRNEFLMQLVADVAQVELAVAETPESSALGGALAGLVGRGVLGSLDDVARLPRAVRSFGPAMSRDAAAAAHAGWRAAVARVL